jgi:histidine ammonia-lyase
MTKRGEDVAAAWRGEERVMLAAGAEEEEKAAALLFPSREGVRHVVGCCGCGLTNMVNVTDEQTAACVAGSTTLRHSQRLPQCLSLSSAACQHCAMVGTLWIAQPHPATHNAAESLRKSLESSAAETQRKQSLTA